MTDADWYIKKCNENYMTISEHMMHDFIERVGILIDSCENVDDSRDMAWTQVWGDQ